MGSWGGEDVVWWWQGDSSGWSNGWSHIHMWWIKIGKVISGATGPSPTSGPPDQDSSAKKLSPHQFWLQTQLGLSQWKKLLDPQAVPLEEPTHGLTFSDSLPLSSSTRVAA